VGFPKNVGCHDKLPFLLLLRSRRRKGDGLHGGDKPAYKDTGHPEGCPAQPAIVGIRTQKKRPKGIGAVRLSLVGFPHPERFLPSLI
jgi:hypothetical protein